MNRSTLAALAALVLAATLAATASAGRTLDPATQRYVDALRTDLAAVAKASGAEHVPCFHSPSGLRGRNCWKLHAALQRATEKTIADLAKVAVPKKLAVLDRKLKAALQAYLARIRLFRAHPERTNGHSIDPSALNDAILSIATQLRTYLPLIG